MTAFEKRKKELEEKYGKASAKSNNTTNRETASEPAAAAPKTTTSSFQATRAKLTDKYGTRTPPSGASSVSTNYAQEDDEDQSLWERLKDVASSLFGIEGDGDERDPVTSPKAPSMSGSASFGVGNQTVRESNGFGKDPVELSTRLKELEDRQVELRRLIAGANRGGMADIRQQFEAESMGNQREMASLQEELDKVRPVYTNETAAQKLDTVKSAESALTQSRASGQTIEVEVQKRGETLTQMEANVKAALEEFERNQTKASYDHYLSAYQQYEQAAKDYTALYDEYKGLVDAYNAAYGDYSTYMDMAKADASGWEIAGNTVKAGIGSVARGIGATVDFLLPAELWDEKDPVSKFINAQAAQAQQYNDEWQESIYGRGPAVQAAAELGHATVAAIPNAIIAMMTYGTSMAGQTTAGLTSMAATAGSSGLASTIGTVARNLAKNPTYWSSMAQTLGTDYEEAKEKGANEWQASAAALISSMLNAGVEVSGGIELLPAKVKSGNRSEILEWVLSSPEEGIEEVIQRFISGSTEKAIYDHDKPIYSTTDPEAIINPLEMGKEFAIGTGVGGILGGAQIGAISAANAGVNRRLGKIGTDYQAAAEELVNEGLTFAPETEAYQAAREVKAKMDAGETVTEADLGRVVVANERTIQAEERLAQANTPRNATESREIFDESDVSAKADTTAAQKENAAEALQKPERDPLLEAAREAVGAEPKQSVPYNVMATDNPVRQQRLAKAKSVQEITGYGEHGAASFTSIVEDTGVDPGKVQLEFESAYQAGRTGLSQSVARLNNSVRMEAYNAGRLDAIMAMNTAKAKAQGAVIRKDAGFDMTNLPKDVTRAQAKAVDMLAKATGVRVRMATGLKGNAEIAEDGSVLIDMDFEREVRGKKRSIVFYAAHEIGMHRLMQLAPAEGQAFINAVIQDANSNLMYGQETVTEKKRAQYAAQDVSLDIGKAMEEVAADSILDLYEDEDAFYAAIDRIMNGKDEQAKSGAKKFKEILDDIVRKLKATIAKLTGKERAEAQQTLSEVEQLRDLFEKGLAAASERVKAENEANKPGRAAESRGTMSYSMKEDGLYGQEGRAENRRAFLERSRRGVRKTGEVGEIAYAYVPVGEGETSRVADEAAQELRKLGVNSFCHAGLEFNENGVTYIDQGDSTSIGDKIVAISSKAHGDGKLIAGHEAFHIWGSRENRFEYVTILHDNMKPFARYGIGQLDVVRKAYFGDGAYDRAMLMEEFFAHISGQIHSGKHDADLATMFKDYAAVKAAWDNLVAQNASTAITEGPEAGVQYSLVTDKDTLDFLNNQERVKVYRAMQEIDGKLYPPMAALMKGESGKKQLVEATEKGTWYQADERPELIKMDKNGKPKFELNKGNGGMVPAAYNPYFHTSASPLNDQFSSAYNRPNIVVVEGYIPKSELSSGYKARYAKDSVGETSWHAGPVASKLKGSKARRVFLSRWFKAERVVPDKEVAKIIAKTLEGEDVRVPWNVVTPSLRQALEAEGVEIDYKSVKMGSKVVSFESTQYSLKDSEGNKLSKEQQDFFKDSKVRDENGNLKAMYHGSQDAGFHTFGTDFAKDSISLFFTDSNTTAKSYSGTHEIYAPKSFRTAEDLNQFFEEIGAREYAVEERDGTFYLLDDGDEVAESDTAAGIYSEFQDWTGIGNGAANYKVYLNLTNPLVLDAEGNNWDELPSIEGVREKYEYIKVLETGKYDNMVKIEHRIEGAEAPKTEYIDLYEKFESGLADRISDLAPGESVKNVYTHLQNTRDYARYARNHDYDGVIFKNVVDNGLYASGMERFETSTVAIAFKPEQVKSVENKRPTTDPDIRFSLKDDEFEAAVNQSMTMQQAKDMVQRAFVLGEIKAWFEGEYRNGDEWLKGEGVDAVAMVIDNEWQLQEKYLNKIQGLMDEDFMTTDILEAYLAGTLTGKVKDMKPKRLNVADGVAAQDDRFYAPHEIENAKAAFETASQKVTNKNRDAVYKARADVIMFAHTRGAAEALGLTQSELNKKLRTWARYNARAKETSERFNAGVADWNKWTGIENSNILSRITVSRDELDRLVGEITGDSDGFQRTYIVRTMLALDTHIDYSGLKFEFVGRPDSKNSNVNGQYLDSARKIRVKHNAPHTVAHEMGHFLDYQWARDIGVAGALTGGFGRDRLDDPDVKQWAANFDKFKDSLTDASDIHSGYSMDAKEVFARFVDKFVQWVNFTANGEQARTYYYNDKFTTQHYIEFVRLLQEKAVLDGKKQQVQFSLKNLDEIKAEYKDKTDHLYLHERMDGTISIDNMVVKKEHRNQGVGTQILNDVIAYADETGKTITLTPTTEFGTKAKLTRWYKANGFVENKGRNADYRLSDTMYRLPRGPQFSLKGLNDLLDENARMRKVHTALQEQFAVTTFEKADKKALDQFAKNLLKDWKSGADINETREALSDFYTFVREHVKGEDPDFAELERRAYEVALPIIQSVVEVDDAEFQQYKDLRNHIKRTGITFDKAYEKDLGEYESLNEFRKAYFGKIRLVNDGLPVNSFYQELATMYPGIFDESIHDDPADQLLHIAEVLDELQPTEVNPYSHNMREATTWLATDIIQRIYDLPQAKPTFGDKLKGKVPKAITTGLDEMGGLLEQQRSKLEQADAENRQAQRELAAAKATGNSLITSNRQLKRELDAMKAENAKIIEESRKKVKDTITGQRMAAGREIEKLKQKQREKDAKRSESQKAREMRAKILRHTTELSKKLLRGTDTSHVPEELRESVAAVLASINREGKYEYAYGTGGKYHRVAAGTELGAEPTKRTEAFVKVREQLEAIVASGNAAITLDPNLLGVSADGISSNLAKVIAMHDIRLDEMNMDQLQTVYDVLRTLEHSIMMAGKMLTRSKWMHRHELADAFMRDAESRRDRTGRFNRFMLDIETPLTFFSHYGEAGRDFFQMLLDAQDHQQRMQDQVEANLANVVSLEARKKAEKDTVTITTQRGQKLTLNKAHVMEIYLLNKRDQARQHLLSGGIIQPEAGKVRKGTKAVLLNELDIANIIGTMTEAERKIADGLQSITLLLADWGNEASMAVYGYKKFRDPNYWTIRSSNVGLNETVEADKNRPRSIANMGSAKNLTPNASNTLDINGAFDTFDRHVSDMVCYAAWLAPMEDANAMFNYRFRDENWQLTGDTMKDIIESVGGEGSQDYWKNLMKDIQNGISTPADTAVERVIMKGIGNVKKASVSGNIRVIVQQPTAYARAAVVLGPDVMLAALAKDVAIAPMLRGWNKAVKYAPIAARKAAGGYEIASNPKQLGELLYHPETKTGKGKKFLQELPLAGASLMDQLTWGTIWNACELQVRKKDKNLKKDSDEFNDAVAKLFSDVIIQTQVVDGVLQRSQAMRSGSNLMKQATSFTGEPTQGANMILRAYDQLRYETDPKKRAKAVKKLSRAVSVFMGTAVLNAFAQALVDGFRDDDDEKDYWEKVWASFAGINGDEETWFDLARNVLLAGNVANNVNPLTWIPYGKDVFSVIQGYSVERMDMANLEDFVSSLSNVVKTLEGDGKYTTGYAALKALTLGHKLLGGSSYNYLRDIEGAIRTFQVETGDYKARYDSLKQMTKPENNKKQFMDLLYSAYMDDYDAYQDIYDDLLDHGYTSEDLDQAIEDRILGVGLKESGFDSTARYYDEMFNKLVAGDMYGYMQMVEALENIGVIDVSSIESAMRTRANKADMSYEDYNDLMAAAGLKLKFDVEDVEEDTYSIDDLSISQYSTFVEERGDIIDDVISEFQLRGFGDLDAETANRLLGAAYSFAADAALEAASGGEYESDTKWINLAQDAPDDLGISVAEYILLKDEYSAASLAADTLYEAASHNIAPDFYLETRKGMQQFKGENKQKQIIAYLNDVCSSEAEFYFMMGTEYESWKKKAKYKAYFGG